MPAPLVVINAVGLTPRLLSFAPQLSALSSRGWCVSMREVNPAVTCTAQATLLTGQIPSGHGIVGNGWLFRDTQEVRFWQQSNRLIQAEPVYATAKRRAGVQGRPFKVAKLFWWFNQGARVDFSITPKPHYAFDGRKSFDVLSTPTELGESIRKKIGPFPFAAFWGPLAGIESTRWIAAAAALTILDERPDLSLVYLPHLDYDPQRFGPSGCDMRRQVEALDTACAPLLEAANAIGARVWVISEYGHCDVAGPVFPNRLLRQTGLLAVRPGPFGEQLDLFASRAFAICDHQLAHVYVNDRSDIDSVAEKLRQLPGLKRILVGDQCADIGLDHPRSGEIILLAEPQTWFAYPFWLDDVVAPDYARNVAIHHKPGFDPCELFFDSKILFPKVKAARKLLQKTLGFRMAMNMTPLDATIVRGSHGLPAKDDADRPLWIGDGPAPGTGCVPMTAFRDGVLKALDLAGETVSS